MPNFPVKQGTFNGKCAECGDIAELRETPTTALLQSQDDHRLSTVATGLVVGPYCGHSYFLLLWDTQVLDPFEEGEDLEMEE